MSNWKLVIALSLIVTGLGFADTVSPFPAGILGAAEESVLSTAGVDAGGTHGSDLEPTAGRRDQRAADAGRVDKSVLDFLNQCNLDREAAKK